MNKKLFKLSSDKSKNSAFLENQKIKSNNKIKKRFVFQFSKISFCLFCWQKGIKSQDLCLSIEETFN